MIRRGLRRRGTRRPSAGPDRCSAAAAMMRAADALRDSTGGPRSLAMRMPRGDSGQCTAWGSAPTAIMMRPRNGSAWLPGGETLRRRLRSESFTISGGASGRTTWRRSDGSGRQPIRAVPWPGTTLPQCITPPGRASGRTAPKRKSGSRCPGAGERQRMVRWRASFPA